MKIPKLKRELILKALKDGTIKRLGNNTYSVPSNFFVQGITPWMVSEVDKEGGANESTGSNRGRPGEA